LNTTGAVTLFGFYQRERYRERAYRWSAAAGMIGFDVPKAAYVFEVEVDDLRGQPASFLADVYFNGHRLKRDSLRLGRDRIRGRLEPRHFRPDGPQYLVLVCVPIRRADIAPDRRELGFPLFGFRIDDERSSPIW
jgi:hypothetical protein